jgi:general secretion pathway protein K
MVSVAVLTALAVDLAYESRVSLRIAANARDELRASYQARSGVALSRLVLSFQQQVDEAMPAVAGQMIPRLVVWRMIPVGSGLASSLFGGPGGPPAAAPEQSVAASPNGSFEAAIDDEGRKANAQLEGFLQTGRLAPQVQSLYQLVCDPRWDPIFEGEDASGQRTSREDLLVRLRDWVDEDDRTSELVATAAATSCGLKVEAVPFREAFGDENAPYDRGEDRYRAKNARMDSLDELYLVAGVGDAFMTAFGDGLTVYLPRDAHRNINETEQRRLVELAQLIATPAAQPGLFDPEFGKRLQKLVLERTFGGLLSMTPAVFGQLVQEAGVLVDTNLIADTNPNNPFTDRSTTFRIRSAGVAGDVTSRIDAVVRLEKAQAGEAVDAPGRIIHWREE